MNNKKGKEKPKPKEVEYRGRTIIKMLKPKDEEDED